MRVRMGLIRKKPEWSITAFHQYWRDTHGPLAARAPTLREYWQNAVADRVAHGIGIARGPWEFDGFSQLWFADVEHAGQAFGDGAFAASLIADEAHFLGVLHIVTATQQVVVSVPAEPDRAALLKCLSIVRRRPEIGDDQFHRDWRIHGELVCEMPGVCGYRLNTVIARERVKGQPCGYEELPIDGIAELWFETAASPKAACSSPPGRGIMQHAKTFLAEATAFLVVERRVV